MKVLKKAALVIAGVMTDLAPIREGLFQEPSGAIALAGVAEARRRGLIDADEVVVACLTGTGLKDPHAAAGGDQRPFPEVATTAELERVLAGPPSD